MQRPPTERKPAARNQTETKKADTAEEFELLSLTSATATPVFPQVPIFIPESSSSSAVDDTPASATHRMPPLPLYAPPPLPTLSQPLSHPLSHPQLKTEGGLKGSKLKEEQSSAEGDTEFLVREMRLEDIIIKSTLADKNAEAQAENILQAFNVNVKPSESCFSRSLLLPRGKWINRDEFLLGHRNKIPELAPFNPEYNIASKITLNPTVQTEMKNEPVKINDDFYGWHGSYVLNVPAGKFAKAYTANGKIPLIFGPGPHVIHDRTFKFDKKTGFIDQAAPYIKHETIHIVRVPAGMVAKVRLNTQPELLEGPKLCVFNSPFLELVPRSDHPNDLFHKATEQLIELDAKKRVMPYPYQVAVTYKGSILEIIHPKKEPTIISDPSHRVESFLDTQMRTLVISSKQNENVNRHDNKQIVVTSDQLTFRTNDPLEITVSIMVAFKIKDPETVIKELKNHEEIIKHIVNRAIVDMGMIIAGCSLSNFLYSTNTRINKPDDGINPSVNYQDLVKKTLGDDLRPLGIELINLSIETPDITNQLIKDEMQKQAVTTAQTNATQSNLLKNLQIAKTQAEQAATQKQIQQEQENRIKLSQAETDLKAAEMHAQATMVEAKAKRDAAELMGKLYRDYPELLTLELAEKQAKTFASANLYVTPHEMRSMFATPFNLFPQGQPQQLRGLPQQHNRKELPREDQAPRPAGNG